MTFMGTILCNNAMAGSVVSILVAIALLIIDLLIPCTSSTVSCHCTVATVRPWPIMPA